MANEIRVRTNFIGGLVEDNPLTAAAATLTSAGLAALVSIGATQHAAVVLDPDGINGSPEIIYITAHSATFGTATIARGQEGTTARQHDRDTTWVHSATALDFDRPLLHVRDEKAAGTAGGASTSGSYAIRTLNTVAVNEISGASLTANVITLPAGTYEINARAPVFGADRSKARLYNVTAAAVLVQGSSNYGGTLQSDCIVIGRFVLAASSGIRLELRVANANATQGAGVESNFGDVEVYAEVQIRKVG